MSGSGKSIRWNEDENPRDVTAVWGSYTLRVKAENHGTVWMVYINGPGLEYQSEHVSKDAAKQRAAKVARQAAVEAGLLSE